MQRHCPVLFWPFEQLTLMRHTFPTGTSGPFQTVLVTDKHVLITGGAITARITVSRFHVLITVVLIKRVHCTAASSSNHTRHQSSQQHPREALVMDASTAAWQVGAAAPEAHSAWVSGGVCGCQGA
jgi:hypothetical protein